MMKSVNASASSLKRNRNLYNRKNFQRRRIGRYRTSASHRPGGDNRENRFGNRGGDNRQQVETAAHGQGQGQGQEVASPPARDKARAGPHAPANRQGGGGHNRLQAEATAAPQTVTTTVQGSIGDRDKRPTIKKLSKNEIQNKIKETMAKSGRWRPAARTDKSETAAATNATSSPSGWPTRMRRRTTSSR